jgi:hypothetical protein
VKQPNFFLMLPLLALALIPGLIAIQLLTKNYIAALTNRRLIVLRVKGVNLSVQEIIEYPLSSLPPVVASTGPIFTHIRVRDQAKPFAAKFHRSAMKGKNRESAMAIAASLTGISVPAQAATISPPAPPQTQKASGPILPHVPTAAALDLRIGPVTRALNVGMAIEPSLLGAAGAGRGSGPIAQIVDHSQTGLSAIGLKNTSNRIYRAKLPDGKTIEIPTGQTVRLWPGVAIDFGGIEGVVQAR